jgi:uncharacterized protein YutE (UPF0331/DUF86 family)
MRHEPAAYLADIIGFRNVLTHDYAGVDDESVFDYARTDIVELRRICKALLERGGD